MMATHLAWQQCVSGMPASGAFVKPIQIGGRVIQALYGFLFSSSLCAQPELRETSTATLMRELFFFHTPAPLRYWIAI